MINQQAEGLQAQELAELSLKVAKAEGWCADERHPEVGRNAAGLYCNLHDYRPMYDPAEILRLLIKYQLDLEWLDGKVRAEHPDLPPQELVDKHRLGESVCRAIVGISRAIP